MTGNRATCGPVLVADDDPAIVHLLREALADARLKVCAASSGSEALARATVDPPRAAVLDVNLPDVSGYEVCRELRRLYGPSIPIVFVSGDRTEEYDRVGGLLLGADEYVVKPFDPREVVARLDRLLDRARRTAVRSTLTPRELEILTRLAEGLTQTEIAARLEISPKTVATHIERILGKLGVRSRAQAVAIAFRDTLVPLSA